MALCSDRDILLVFAKIFPFVMFKKDLKQQKITVTENKFSLVFFTYLRKNFIHLPNKQKKSLFNDETQIPHFLKKDLSRLLFI